MKLTAIINRKQTQHQRLQDEYIEYRRYGEYGDRCDGHHCNQCPYLGAEGCMKHICIRTNPYFEKYKNI